MEDIFTTIVIIGVVFLLFMGVLGIEQLGYKNGQVDAINGVIKYELVKNDDGSTEWQKIKEK